jgi:hypothetical protein
MATSKTIAALLGPTLVASAASIFLNLDAWPGMVDQAFHNPGLVFVSGYPLFVVGLAIVYFHNQWKGGWPVVVTVLGWLAVFSGLLRILFPTRLAEIATRAVQTAGVMPIAALLILVIGAFLSFKAAAAARDGRASLRHDQGPDGSNPLPDEDAAAGRL